MYPTIEVVATLHKYNKLYYYLLDIRLSNFNLKKKNYYCAINIEVDKNTGTHIRQIKKKQSVKIFLLYSGGNSIHCWLLIPDWLFFLMLQAGAYLDLLLITHSYIITKIYVENQNC